MSMKLFGDRPPDDWDDEPQWFYWFIGLLVVILIFMGCMFISPAIEPIFEEMLTSTPPIR